MDIATVGGLVGGLLLMLAALFIAGGSGQTVALAQFVDPPAALLVFGGGLCVVLASVPMREFRKLPSILRKLVFPKSSNPTALVEELVRMAGIARSDGLLALEAQAQEITNPTLALALQMAVDGTRPEVITEILKNEIEHAEAHGRPAVKLVPRRIYFATSPK